MTTEKKTFIGALQDFWNSFEKPSSWYVELAAYLIAGFIVGFLVKHGGRFFFLLLLGAFLAMWVLDYFNLVTIHYTMVKSVIGLPTDITFNHVSAFAITWVKEHIIESLVTFFGFIIAWKFA